MVFIFYHFDWFSSTYSKFENHQRLPKMKTSGERGIRTPGTFDSTSDFESGALNQLCHLSFTRRSPFRAKAGLFLQPKLRLRRRRVYNKCLFKNALPDPVFRYCSNSNALLRSGKEQHHANLTGSLSFVIGTQPFWCRLNRSFKLLVHPV